MEYNNSSQHIVKNYNDMRYVGWQSSNDCVKAFYSPMTVKIISRKVTELLQGVDPFGRKIVVSDDNISSIMSSLQNNYVPQVGDIHSRYNVSSNGKPQNMVQELIDRCIEIIVMDIWQLFPRNKDMDSQTHDTSRP